MKNSISKQTCALPYLLTFNPSHHTHPAVPYWLTNTCKVCGLTGEHPQHRGPKLGPPGQRLPDQGYSATCLCLSLAVSYHWNGSSLFPPTIPAEIPPPTPTEKVSFPDAPITLIMALTRLREFPWEESACSVVVVFLKAQRLIHFHISV